MNELKNNFYIFVREEKVGFVPFVHLCIDDYEMSKMTLKYKENFLFRVFRRTLSISLYINIWTVPDRLNWAQATSFENFKGLEEAIGK